MNSSTSVRLDSIRWVQAVGHGTGARNDGPRRIHRTKEHLHLDRRLKRLERETRGGRGCLWDARLAMCLVTVEALLPASATRDNIRRMLWSSRWDTGQEQATLIRPPEQCPPHIRKRAPAAGSTPLERGRCRAAGRHDQRGNDRAALIGFRVPLNPNNEFKL